MQLPNRTELENSFAARFTRVNAKLRHRLEDYLGFPPNPANVPASFWQEVEDEMNRELAIVLLLIWSQSAIHHGLDAQAAQTQGLAYAQGRAATVAADFAANTRTMVDTAARRWAEATPTRAGAQTDLVIILGPTRAQKIAITETTKSQTAGGEAGIGQTVGLSGEDLWITKLDGRVCKVCAPLHKKPRSVWQLQFPAGPGDDVHPLCRCFIQYALVPGAI